MCVAPRPGLREHGGWSPQHGWASGSLLGPGRGDAYREGTCAPRPPHRVPRRMRGGRPAARGAARRRPTVRRSRRTACTRRRRAAAAVDGSVVSSSWDTLPPEGVMPAGRSGAPRTLHAPLGPPHPSTLSQIARGSSSRLRRQRHRAALPRRWEHRRLGALPRDAWERLLTGACLPPHASCACSQVATSSRPARSSRTVARVVRTASAAIGLYTSPWSAASRPLEASARHTRRRCRSTARRFLGATRRAMRWAARAAGTVPSRAFVLDAKGAVAAEGSPSSPHRPPPLRLVRRGLVRIPLVRLLAALHLPPSLRVGCPGACCVPLHCWGSDTPQHAAVVISILL